MHNIARNLALLCISYIELCVLFAVIYLGLHEQFRLCAVEPKACISTFPQAFHYSVTTITTLGYGDIVPLTDQARLISSVQTLAGIGMLALGITRLITFVEKPAEIKVGK